MDDHHIFKGKYPRPSETVDDEGEKNPIFPVKRYPTLESLDSYVIRYQQMTSNDEDVFDDYGLAVPTGDRFSKDNMSDTYSMTSRKKANHGSKRKRKGRSTAVNGSDYYDVRNHYYAGIGHSDLDIQTNRPPLMYQMDVCEWLWFQSTIRHRLILFVTGFLLAVVFLNIGFSGMVIFTGEQRPNPYVCNTDSCKFLATRIKLTLNRSVKPCDDFYAFVCGTSGVNYGLSKEEENRWGYAFEDGRIHYDFDYSVSLGNMLKPTKKFPDSLALTMYKGCLDRRQRNKLKLQPYYDFLKEVKLYNISKADTSLTGADVIESIARILANFLTESAIVRVVYHFDEKDQMLKSYIEPSLILPSVLRGGAVHRHGYRLFHDTIKDALMLVKDELKITDEELFILPHDLLCMDLYLRDFYFSDDADSLEYIQKIFGDQDFTHQGCDLGRKHTNPIEANFGIAGSGEIDWDLLQRRLWQLGNPDDSTMNMNNLDFSTNERSAIWFIKELEPVWRRSSPLRLLRYLQWRVLYDMSFDLNDDMWEVMVNIRRYKTHRYITNCFNDLFTWLPFVAPNRFFTQITEERLNEIENRFEKLVNSLEIVQDAMTVSSTFLQVEQVLGLTFTSRQKILLRNMIFYFSQTEDIPPVAFKAKNFPTYPDLYQGIEFSETRHFYNILKMGRRMHQWRVNPKYYNVFWDIDPVYHTRILVDTTVTIYDAVRNSLINYLPIGSVQRPFFDDGLKVADSSGLGLIIAGAQERAFHHLYEIPNGLAGLVKKMERRGYEESQVLEMYEYLKRYVNDLKNKIRQDLSKWKTEGISWADITDVAARDHILETVIMDEGRYEAVSLMVNLFLKRPENQREAKLVLRGLEEFDAKKLYFITLVNRRCDVLGKKKFAHISQFGPLSQAIRNNIQLSYQDDFAKTFNCPLNSMMNPKDKVYFHDRWVNVTIPATAVGFTK